jgi:hypothetical protein
LAFLILFPLYWILLNSVLWMTQLKSQTFWKELYQYDLLANVVDCTAVRSLESVDGDLEPGKVNRSMIIVLFGSIVGKALCYKPEGRGFETRSGE